MGGAAKLQGREYQELLSALLSAYDANSFARMLRIELDKSVAHFAPVGASLTEQFSAVIDAAEREGWLDALVDAAAQYNPGNPAMAQFAARRRERVATDEAAQITPARPPRPPWVNGLAALLAITLIAGMVWAILSLFNNFPSDAPPTPTSLASPTPAITATSTAASIAAPNVCYEGIAPAVETLDDMVLIPGGSFVMGDNLPERPQHEVTVGNFWIDRFEVTNLQYQEYLLETGALPPEGWRDVDFPEGQTAFQPVTAVTWQDAARFCEAKGKRLPTEAEWEYACRSGENRRFPWGNDAKPGAANTAEAGCGQALSVGVFSPQGDSVFGVADLMGNVMEWTASLARPYPHQADTQAQPEDTESGRVVRGSAWLGTQEQLTCATRSFWPLEVSVDFLGFRCAQDATDAP